MPVTPDFKERLNQISVRNMKKTHKFRHHWPMEKKIEVVSQFLVIGNLKQVAAITGMDYGLLRQWKLASWWKELELEIRQTQNLEMDTKLSKIVDKSLDAVLDRVENGDFIYDQKSGQIKRKPAALRDIHRVATDTISKRELLRGNATERKETTQVSITEQLKLLAAEFARMTGAKPKETIDVEMVEVIEDAVYSEQSDMQEMPEDRDFVSESLEQEESETLPSDNLPGLRDVGNQGPSTK